VDDDPVVRHWGSHIFYRIGSQTAVKLSALGAGRCLPPRKIPGTNFFWRLSRPRGHSANGRIKSIEKSKDLTGNRTRDLPACRLVSQPTTLPRAPYCLEKCPKASCLWDRAGSAPTTITKKLNKKEDDTDIVLSIWGVITKIWYDVTWIIASPEQQSS
jgi:hypothetical protein